MRIFAAFVFSVFSFGISAGEIQLKQSGSYTVPKGKTWVLKKVEPAECIICTSDLQIDGRMNFGTNSEIVVYGKFEISFNNRKHKEVHLLSGTKFFLGDSRHELRAIEINE